MPLAMGVVFISLFVVISRRHALTQVIGFLMLENGIALLAVLGTYGIPLIVELGVFLDVLMGFLVMQIFVYQIYETFESLDVEQLNRPRRGRCPGPFPPTRCWARRASRPRWPRWAGRIPGRSPGGTPC